MAKQPCCIRSVNLNYQAEFTSTYTARSDADGDEPGDINYSPGPLRQTAIDVNTRQSGEEYLNVSKETKGDESSKVSSEFANEAKNDFQNNPDQWNQNNNIGSPTPESEAQAWGEANAAMLAENPDYGMTTGGSYTYGANSPYTRKTENNTSPTMSRLALFCGDQFMSWIDTSSNSNL